MRKRIGLGLVLISGLMCAIYPNFILILFIGAPAILLTIGAVLMVTKNE